MGLALSLPREPKAREQFLEVMRELELRAAMRFWWSDKQQLCIDEIERIRREQNCTPIMLYGGAMGGGKSHFGCQYSVDTCEKHPGIRGYMFRKESVTFKKTTLFTLRDDADGVRILDRPGWDERESKQYFIHKNGSRIDYGGLGDNKDREKVKSMNIDFAFGDEVSEVEKLSAMLVESRVGRNPNFLPFSFVLYTSNPEQCWLNDDFILQTLPGHGYVQALPTDNPWLAAGYIEHLQKVFAHDPAMLKAYMEGIWGVIGMANSMYSAQDVANAMTRIIIPADSAEEYWGVDVARYGDDETVLTSVCDYRSRIEDVWKKEGVDVTSERIMARYKAASRKPRMIGIDDDGVGGGVTDILSRAKLPVMGIKSGETQGVPDKFKNRKTMIKFRLKMMLERNRPALPDDLKLRTDLTSQKFRVKDGVIVAETKDELKKRLGRSPDRGDAIENAYHVANIYGGPKYHIDDGEVPAAPQVQTGTYDASNNTMTVPFGPWAQRPGRRRIM